MRNFLMGLKALIYKARRDRDLDEEVRAFLEASAADKVRNGASSAQAQRAARLEMGSPEGVKEAVRSAGWESIADSLWQDLRFSIRMLAKTPGFTAVALVSLALGIGANTAIFTLVNDLMLRSLDVRAPEQLVAFGTQVGGGTIDGITPGPLDQFPYEFYKRIRIPKDMLQGIAAYGSFTNIVSYRIGGEQAAAQGISHLVSGNFFQVLGATALLGRTMTQSDADVPGRDHVAVVSYRFWQSKLGSDPNVVDQTIRVNGSEFTIIGVMPAHFSGVSTSDAVPDFWLPLTLQPEVMLQPSLLETRGLYWLHMMGRRQGSVNPLRIQSWVTGQLHQYMLAREGRVLSQRRRREIAGVFVEARPGDRGISNLRARYADPLKILMGVVALVLLIACVNLANFLLARASSREREIATRLALGCGRARIVRQLLLDALLLAGVGGVLGLGVSYLSTRGLIHFVTFGHPGESPLSASPDARVLFFTVTVSLMAGVLFGLFPALRIPQLSATPGSQAGVRSAASAGGRAGRAIPLALLAAQVIFSLILLASAGLFVGTLHNLRTRDFGFNRTNVLAVQFNAKFAGYKPEQLNAFYTSLLERLSASPGLQSATISGVPPISPGNWISPIFFKGRVTAREDTSTLLNRVGPRYFETVGIPLVAGRTIAATDSPTALKVAVVNQALADYFFPAGDVIGHTFTVADPSVKGEFQIVGVVRNSKYSSPREDTQRMTYLPVMQITGDDAYAYSVEVRTSGEPASAAGQVRRAIASVDPNVPVLGVKTMAELTDMQMANEILISRLSGFFSVLALALACIGLYGVMTYNVLRRSGEIGIRMTLGAQASTVLSMILKESMVLLGIGIAFGIPATVAITRVFQSQLFGLRSSDPGTLAGAVLIVSVVVLISAFFPARRAAQMDPMVTLRYQ